MQPTNYPVKHDVLDAFWHTYMTQGRAEGEFDPIVLASWTRCSPRLSARTYPVPVRLHQQALSRVLQAQSNLMTFSAPFIEDVHQFMAGAACAIVLTDGRGWHSAG